MPNKRQLNYWFFATAITFMLCFVIGYGFFYERYIVFLETLFSGSITGVPLFDFLNIAFVGLDKIFAWLYHQFPNFYWLDASHIAVAFVAILLYLWGIAMLAAKRGLGFWAGALLAANASTLVYFNLVSNNNSREAFFLVSILLFFFWGYNTHKPKWQYLLAIISFVLIALLRVEFALLALIVFGGFVAVQYQWLKQQWKWLIAPVLFLIFMGGYLYVDRNYSSSFAKESDFSQYLIADADNFDVLETFNNKKDSLRYLAAKELWLSDTTNLKIDFFRSLQQYKIGFSLNYFQHYFPKYFENANQLLWQSLIDNLPFLILVLSLLAYFIIESFWAHKNIRQRWKVLLLPFLWQLALLWFLCYTVRMETTVLQPMLLVSVLFLLGTNNKPTQPVLNDSIVLFSKSMLITILAINLLYANYFLYQHCTSRKGQLNISKAVCNEANKLAAGKYLMLDTYSTDILDHRMGYNFVFNLPKNILLYDCGQLILTEPYLSYHAKVCNCNPLDNKAFYSFLLRNKKEVLILSEKSRMDFVTGYLQGMHQMKISYKPLQGNFIAHQLSDYGMNLHYYTLTDSL